MTDKGNDIGVLNGQVTTPVLISEISTPEGREVTPELVDYAKRLAG